MALDDESSTASRYESWFLEEVSGKPRRRRARRLAALATPRHRVRWLNRNCYAPPVSKATCEARQRRVFEQAARQVNVEGWEPGHELWTSEGAPPTLVAGPDGVRGDRRIVERIARFRTKARRPSLIGNAPIAIVKVSLDARGTPLGIAVETEAGGLETGASESTGHAVGLLWSTASVARLVELVVSHGTTQGYVAVQAFTRTTGPTAWFVRAIAGKSSAAWVVSDPSHPWITSTARRCTLVRGAIKSWTEPKSRAAALLDKWPHVEELAADFAQDDAGVWWLLQIKGFRRGPPLVKTKKPPAVRSEPRLSRCAGEYCDFAIPEVDRHLYNDVQGAPFALPRKVLIDHPRSGVPIDLSDMPRAERLSLYDNIRVCANCHYEYAGKRRVCQHRGVPRQVTPDLATVREPRLAVVREPVAVVQGPAPPVQKPGPIVVVVVEDTPPVREVETPQLDAASVLRAAMSDIDAIYDRAAEQMAQSIDSTLTASLFLSSIDDAVHAAHERGRSCRN